MIESPFLILHDWLIMGLNSLIMGLNWLINTLELLFIYYFRRYWEPSRKVPGEGNIGVPAALGVSVDVRGMAKLNPHPAPVGPRGLGSSFEF